jgi:hypothetical protein
MDPNVRTRPSSSEVLLFLKKKWNEIKPALEQNPRPIPFRVQEYDRQQYEDHRNAMPNLQDNVGASRFGGGLGRMPPQMPRGMPGHIPGFGGLDRRGFNPMVPKTPNKKRFGARGEMGRRSFPPGYSEPPMNDDWFDEDATEDVWEDNTDLSLEDEGAYVGREYDDVTHMYYGGSRMPAYGRNTLLRRGGRQPWEFNSR